MKKETIVLDTDEGIIKWGNMNGWIGKNGRFYGNNKDQAIYDNSTHKKCEEGHTYKRMYINCPECTRLSIPEQYKKLEHKAWDGKTPLALYNDDVYFFDEDAIIDYMYDNDLTKDEIMLVYCKPCHLDPVDESYWEEAFPEDWGLEDVSKEVSDKLKELNEAISKSRPASWWPTNIRTIYDFEPKTGAPM